MSTSKHHNAGQTDRAEHNGYHAPHGVVADLTTWTSSGMQKIAADNTAYRHGWNNTDGQIKDKK